MKASRPAPRWHREPLVWFAALAAAIVLLNRALTPPPPDELRPEPPIVIDDAFAEGLVAARRAAGAPADREAAIEEWVREEVLVREARSLGLDRGDPIVRQRLVQKMELLIETHVEVEPPTEEELAAALAQDPRYREPPRVRFDHVFFASRREDAEGDARRALEQAPSAPTGGDPFLRGATIGPMPLEAVRSAFGEAFAAAIGEAPPDAWSGPHPSAYGWHLVRIAERRPGALPPLDEVRGRVRADLMRARRAAATRDAIDARVRQAAVERP